ncbi:hypothetical protein [Aeromicrobium ginsengisoli]|uniref:Uncharacterized protein n=1 Tax=Aeromicrobium ginsengisoli TaxID=363867 RepID=A0A5M4FFA6_9ACTN|nr:hypothetical protein [Aeromicrobium ginsengisoli]KAA1397513.1 hypothetical protein ESP70_009055 [Aeromicrobium ginsengisoli]
MTRVRHVVAAVVVLVLMAGCNDGGVRAEPKDTTKVGAADLKSTRAEILDLIDTAVTTASAMAGGQERPRSGEVKSVGCDAIYPRRFRHVEANGAFVVPDADRVTVVRKIRDAWQAEGWKPEVGGKEVVGEDGEVLTTRTASSGVPLTIRAIVLESPSGQAAVNVDVRTSCLELSRDALDALDQAADDDR